MGGKSCPHTYKNKKNFFMKKFSILIVLICICVGFSGCALFVPVWECLTEPYPSTTYYYYGGCYHTNPPRYCGHYHSGHYHSGHYHSGHNGHYHSGHHHRPHKPNVTHTHNGHTHRPNSKGGHRGGSHNWRGGQGGRGHKR